MEIKSIITEMKNSLEKFNSKFNMAEGRIRTWRWINKNYLCWRIERILENEQFQRPLGHHQPFQHTHNGSPRKKQERKGGRKTYLKN